jgi:hypothetical protein
LIEVQTDLWIGNWEDVKDRRAKFPILNVCHDLYVERDDVPYLRCGLQDGPGNTLAMYHAAVLMLWSLAQDGPVMVAGHEGSGCCAVVAIMYLHLTRRMGWDHWFRVILNKFKELPEPHKAHRTAFHRINWRLLNTAIGET